MSADLAIDLVDQATPPPDLPGAFGAGFSIAFDV